MTAIRILSSTEDLTRHEAWVSTQKQGTLWQSAAWRRYQATLGRQTRVYAAECNGVIMAAASVIIDTTAGGFSVWECPRGPVWTTGNELEAASLLETVVSDAKKERCIQLFVSPPIPLETCRSKLVASSRHIHPQATLLLDLSLSEDRLLAQMHPKGRYNIKVAEKQGISVTTSSDISAFYSLMTSTGQRDSFTIHKESHYKRFLESLDSAFLLLATHAEKPIAGLLGVTWNGTGIYYYGASSYEHRALMAPYALQWAAIRHCKALGCTQYDLLGIDVPDAPPTAWKGITDFKRKFGGTLHVYPAEQQLMLRPLVSLALGLKRKILG